MPWRFIWRWLGHLFLDLLAALDLIPRTKVAVLAIFAVLAALRLPKKTTGPTFTRGVKL